MESLVQWYAENGSALWTTIIGFLSAYGVALVGLVIGIIRTKLASNKATEKMCATLTKLADEFKNVVEEHKEEIIAACDANTAKRIAKMQEIADATNAANENLEEAQTTDANDALNNLE